MTQCATIIFVHSAGEQSEGQGSSKLLQYLRSTLTSDFKLIAPAMPNPNNPNAMDWMDELDAVIHKINDKIILLGHSLGGSIIFKYLSERNCENSISGIISLAAPYWGLDGWHSEEFTLQYCLAEAISSNIPIHLYHDYADEIVPFHHINTYTKALTQAETYVVTGQGHLFEREFPELIKTIRSFSNQHKTNTINH